MGEERQASRGRCHGERFPEEMVLSVTESQIRTAAFVGPRGWVIMGDFSQKSFTIALNPSQPS